MFPQFNFMEEQMSNQNGSGPKTAFGKKRSSRNARRHGLFSAAFSLSPAEEEEYKKLSSDFREQLKPDNSLLDALFQDVVASFWDLRIARGYKQQESKKLFAAQNEETAEKPQGVGESFPSGVKAWQRGQVIKLLEYLRDQVETRRVLPPDLEEAVTQACGAYFWKALAEWTPVDRVAIIAANMAYGLMERHELFGTKIPGLNVSPEFRRKYLALDGFKEKEMM